MELYEREYFIARIRAGYLRYQISPGLILRIYSPNMHEDYESREVYLDAYQESFLSGAFKFEEMVETLFEDGIWTIEEEETIERLPEDVENFKVEMYNCYASFNSSRIEKVRQYLRVAEQEYVRLQTKKNMNRSATCEGIAELAREHWLIENCTRYPDGRPYEWNEVSLTNIQVYGHTNSISEANIREIANSDPWKGAWNTTRITGNFFHNSGLDLTKEQASLLGWSKMYDNIKESPDCPPDEVLDDEDLLDGFLLSESRKRDRERKNRAFDNQPGAHSSADEVFIPVGTNVHDASRVQQMNNMRGKMISKQRVAVAEEHGEVKYQNMPDVKMRINQQAKAEQTKK